MARLRDFIVRASQHTYFLELKHLRFQILFFAGLVLVPLFCGIGWPTTFAALTDNLLFVDRWGQVVIIFLLCLISSWTGMVMIFIVLDLGPRRFGVAIAPRQATAQERRRDRWKRLTIFGLPILAPAIGMLACRTLAALRVTRSDSRDSRRRGLSMDRDRPLLHGAAHRRCRQR